MVLHERASFGTAAHGEHGMPGPANAHTHLASP